MYNDKLQYIEKLKAKRSELQSKLTTERQKLDAFEKLLTKYDLKSSDDLEKFIEKILKEE